MATVGLSTFSMTKLKGSVTPLSSRVSRCSISGSNLEKRSATRRGQPLERVDELADGLDLSLHVHGDDDVELVFDVGDEVEHGEAVPLEVLGEARRLGDRHALLVEGLDQLDGLGIDFGTVGHKGSGILGSLVLPRRLSNAMGRKRGALRSPLCERPLVPALTRCLPLLRGALATPAQHAPCGDVVGSSLAKQRAR